MIKLQSRKLSKKYKFVCIIHTHPLKYSRSMPEVVGAAFSTHNRTDEMHIKVKRDCGSIPKIYTSFSQIKSQDRTEEGK